jgi:hypothetical protein
VSSDSPSGWPCASSTSGRVMRGECAQVADMTTQAIPGLTEVKQRCGRAGATPGARRRDDDGRAMQRCRFAAA